MSRRVAVVPHTHWDREWHQPFQTFRQDLVEVLDELLDLLESDPSYSHFLLDGQMAMVDDYLEVRPGAEARIASLAGAGRLTMGPWYVLMDEFLVSGETIVRNLQKGLARATAFGGAMDVGYLPDMFGHVGQMPQILRLAGLPRAVVWRGVPSEIASTGFWWEAPDGSAVRAEYLPVGYGNGSSLPSDAKALVRRATDHVKEVADLLIDDLLYMNGSDHLRPHPWLGRVIEEANEIQDDLRFEITSLPAYLAGAPTEGLPLWRGELRSGARANVLMGVTSNRVDVKRSTALTERAIERRAEPYAALFLPAAEWPERLLELAWHGAVLNSAHDSICACSVDDVVDAVLQRTAESRQIAAGLAERALGALARSLADPGPAVVNPSSRPRSGVVELVVSADEPAGPHVQVLSERFGLPRSMTVDADTMRTVLGMLQGTKISDGAWVHDVAIDEDETGIDLTVTIGAEERGGVPVAEVKQDLYTRLGARPDVVVRVTLDQPPIRRIAARAATVPGFGWRSFSPRALAHPVTVEIPEGVDRGAGGTVALGNGLVSVLVEPTDGTFTVDRIAGFGRLVDGGDLGDSYNYSPPLSDTLVDTPESVEVTIDERGPVRARVRITSSYRWPDRVDESSQTREGVQVATVTTELEVRADERALRVATSFVNPSRDHRLRVHLPLPEPAGSSRAECAFGVVSRGLSAEGRPDELGLPTFPARRFVSAGGLTVFHEGVCEYELVDLHQTPTGEQAGSIALTVLRSTGMLSRLGMQYRPLPAGPLTPVEGLQLVGRTITLRYALVLGDVDPWAAVDDLLLPLEVVTSLGGGTRPSRGSELRVDGAEVTAVRRSGGMLEVRVFNPGESPTVLDLGAGVEAWEVDLRGRTLRQFVGSLELRPFGIATIRIARC
ncbi:MAG TPA: hypothetical protein VMU76_06145 [Acidimicrobiales bacterium]|nr:hypothetical protein [Acidimicrobiales bacterium]